ncbi:MAG: hypothetical protein ABI895_21625 [Deltaproteobacteria bacterium]
MSKQRSKIVVGRARRLGRGLALLGAVGALGCGGDDSGDDETPSVLGLFGDNDDDGPPSPCKDITFDSGPSPSKPTGTAHFTPNPVTAMKPELDLVEITCEASRNSAGEVVGFYASFFSEWGESYLTEYAAVSWLGKFAGPGQYDNAKLAYSYDDPSLDNMSTGALVIDGDGLTGHFTSSSSQLSFKCGDASRLSLATVPWPPLPEHTARIVSRQQGIVYEFPNINCSTVLGKFEISTVRTPFRLRFVADGTGTGAHRTVSDDTDYAGGAYNSSSSGGEPFALDCGTTPVTGTISDNLSFVCQR